MKNFNTKTLRAALSLAAFVAVMLGTAPIGMAKTEPVKAIAQVSLRPTGTLILYGTSTLHDWQMTAKQVQGTGTFELGPNGELIGINALTFILPVHNLKGDKDGLNDNAYDALKADKYNDIRFVMTSATIDPTGASKYTVHAKGNLTIAGTTKPIAMEVKAQVNNDGSITCLGTQSLKMSEFNVERPSFMFGAMKAGDALTLSYSVVFVK